jgi:RES domain-containing protein
MIKAWRIVKWKHSGSAFDGEGARLYGGRWNSAGTRMVYTSASRSLAALETLVHLNPPVLFDFVIIPVAFERRWVETLKDLPPNWREEPPVRSGQVTGDVWVREKRSLVLEVPSAVMPGEFNFLLNPTHPDFRKLVIGEPEPFTFDRRLL